MNIGTDGNPYSNVIEKFPVHIMGLYGTVPRTLNFPLKKPLESACNGEQCGIYGHDQICGHTRFYIQQSSKYSCQYGTLANGRAADYENNIFYFGKNSNLYQKSRTCFVF